MDSDSDETFQVIRQPNSRRIRTSGSTESDISVESDVARRRQPRGRQLRKVFKGPTSDVSEVVRGGSVH